MRTNLWRSDEGQAIVEYVLMISLVVGAVAILGRGFRVSLFKLWETLTKEVAGGCPDCTHDPAIRFR